MFNRLAVIGFDLHFSGLENVDRTAAAFYQGEVHTSDSDFVPHGKSALYQQTANRILNANNLNEEQLSVIIISQTKVDLHEGIFAQHCCVPSLANAMLLATQLIDRQNSTVLIIAAHLAEQASKQEHATISFDQNFVDYGENNGVGSILLSSESFAGINNQHIYSYLIGCSVTEDLNKIDQTIEQSLTHSQLNSKQISAVEVTAPSNKDLMLLEQGALLRSYTNGLSLNTSVSCIKSVIGDCAQLSELCGFICSVCALHLRYYSCVKAWLTPQKRLLPDWSKSPFYLLNECTPVFPDMNNVARNMAYSCLSAKQYCHMILQENNDQKIHQNGFNAHCDLTLFVIRADSQNALLEQLVNLREDANRQRIKQLAQTCYQQSLNHTNKRFCMVLLASSIAQLQTEIKLAEQGTVDAFINGTEWKTPQGSFLSTSPLLNPDCCFLYPGIGATYLGLGRDLLHIFPDLFPTFKALVKDSVASPKYQLLYPRSLTKLSFNELKQHDLALRKTLADIAECGVGFACVYTHLFRDILKVEAVSSAGYSMGEVSMFAALDCWQNPGQMSARLANSRTFNKQLSGELKTIRDLWQLAQNSAAEETQLWESYSIKGTAALVEKAILPNERVYITLINTQDSLVIAGYPADCLAVAKRLAVRAIALNVHNAIHCPVAYQEYQQLVDLYTMELGPRIGSKLFSSSCYLPVPFNKKAIAVSIAKCLCERVDFPRLINTLSKQGAQVFIEMGAGRSLCTWADKILTQGTNNKSFLTVAVNAKGSNQQTMIARAVAKMVSIGVKVDLTSFFYGSIIIDNNQPTH